MTFDEWLEFYSPGADKVFTPGEIEPLRAAWDASREECAKVCDSYVGAICEDESNGGASHDYACKSLAGQIRALSSSCEAEQ
jgi:hypothetical protein